MKARPSADCWVLTQWLMIPKLWLWSSEVSAPGERSGRLSVAWVLAQTWCEGRVIYNASVDGYMAIHYNGVIMGVMASQITSLTIAYSTVYSGADQRKHQSSASLAFVRRIHQWPANSPHKGPVTRNCFHLMPSSWVYGVKWIKYSGSGNGVLSDGTKSVSGPMLTYHQWDYVALI